MLKLLAQVVGPKVLKRELVVQDRIGYKLSLKDSPKGWIKALMISNMTKTWQAANLRCNGLNYYTMGEIKNGLSTRFQKDSPMYQAWLGGYIVEYDSDKKRGIKEYCKLPEADQNKWLWHFGDRSAAMQFNAPVFVRSIKNNEIEGRLYSWTGTTHSDVGSKSSSLYTRGLMDGMAAILSKINPNLSLKGSFFVPKLNKGVPSYEPTELKGYFGVFELSPKLTIVLYVCGTDGFGGLKGFEKFLLDNILIEPTPDK